jgi:hypothetical protein
MRFFSDSVSLPQEVVLGHTVKLTLMNAVEAAKWFREEPVTNVAAGMSPEDMELVGRALNSLTLVDAARNEHRPKKCERKFRSSDEILVASVRMAHNDRSVRLIEYVLVTIYS